MLILLIVACILFGVFIGGQLAMSKIDSLRDGWCDCCAYKIFYLQSIEPEQTESDDS